MLHLVLFAAIALETTASEIPPPPPTIGPARDVEAAEALTERRGEVYYHLMRARLALGQGRGGEVQREITAATELMPDEPALLGEAAMLLAFIGRRAEGERLARRALEVDPNELAALRVLADLSLAKAIGPPPDPASRKDAIALYERLAREEESPPHEIFVALARLKAQAGDLDGAAEAARRFVALRPADPNAVRLLTQTLADAGHPDEALDVVLDWLEREPDDAEMVSVAADLSREVGDWSRVETTMRKVLDAMPDHDVAHALMGEALLRAGRPSEAIPHLERAVRGPHAARWASFQLAVAYVAVGRLADADEIARSLAELFPENPLTWSLLGDAAARRSDFDPAIEAYGKSLKAIVGAERDAAEQRDELRRRIASTAIAAKRPDKADEALSALELKDDPAAIEARAQAALAGRRSREARELAGALRRRDALGVAAMIEAESFLQDNQFAKAMERYRDAFSRLGPQARGAAAATLVDYDRRDEAETVLREWARTEPTLAFARFRLGAFLEREGRFDEAEAELRESLRLDPNASEALNYLGYSLADRNERTEEALDLVRRALAIQPHNGAYLDSLAWALYRLGRFEEAREPLERAAREFPHDATVLEHLGDLYRALGEDTEAERVYRRVLEVDPGRRDAIREKLDKRRAAESEGR